MRVNSYLLIEGSTCPVRKLPQVCIKHKGHIYITGCHSNNWYDARIFCQKHGGDLAIIDTEEKIRLILDYVHHNKMYDTCSWLFIGLRKEEWVFPTTGTGK